MWGIHGFARKQLGVRGDTGRMRFVIEQQAGPGNRFGPSSFARQVGKQVPVEARPGEYVGDVDG